MDTEETQVTQVHRRVANMAVVDRDTIIRLLMVRVRAVALASTAKVKEVVKLIITPVQVAKLALGTEDTKATIIVTQLVLLIIVAVAAVDQEGHAELMVKILGRVTRKAAETELAVAALMAAVAGDREPTVAVEMALLGVSELYGALGQMERPEASHIRTALRNPL